MTAEQTTDERRVNFSLTALAAFDELCSESFQREQPRPSEASDHLFAGHAALAA
jgi:hypothetical protein